jgi:exodeoxyribonuclease V alpha subunit
METVTATISKFIFSNDTTSFKVMMTKTQGGKNLIITGEFGPEIIPESIAIFHGIYTNHIKYGHQFKAASYGIIHNAQELASIKLFLDNISENVGPERSEAIIAYFGKDTLNIIENNPDRLTEVPGIGKIIAKNISDAWQENRQKWSAERIVYSLRAFLLSLGLRERRIKKVLNHFGGRENSAEQLIKENPYCLIELDDFGFTTVDFIARQLGTPEDSPLRLKAYIIYLMEFVCPSNGHLFLSTPEMLEITQKYCHENNTKFLGMDISDWDIYQMVRELAADEKLIFEDNIKVYSKKQYNFEKKSALLLAQLMKEKSDLIFLTREKVTEYIDTFEHEHNWILSDEQKKALYFFAEEKVFVITGLPGTGKTSVLKAIVTLAKKLGLSLTCMTPTGISAKKLSGVIQHEAFTIHRRLGYKGNKWLHDEINQYDTDVVIIDEASMVDQEVLFRLLSALKKRTHVIFVGDHNQLPSVGAGNVLRELIYCDQIPTVKLEKIFRQDEASDVIKASHRIIQGDTNLELFKDDPKADIYFLRIKDVSEIERLVMALAAKFKDDRREFQIISARNDGPLGVNPLNNILQTALNPAAPHLHEMKVGNFIVRVGDRIIVKKNDYENGIFNGDIGKVISMAGGKILIKIDDNLIELGSDEVLEKIKLAYSLTVHRVQGQEYDTVILLFINQFGKNMLQRNLLYTALTRAKRKVIVLGHGSAIEKSIENTSVTKRNTILGERIKECLAQKRSPFLCGQPQELEPSPDVKESKEPSSLEGEESSLTGLIEKLSEMANGV